MAEHDYDVLIRGGTVYDGSGGPPFLGDVAITGDSIVSVGPAGGNRSERREIDAAGLAVAPGFINMLSWAAETLIADGRSQSDIRQGVTLELFGEGSSLGPLNQEMKQFLRERQGDIQYDITWTTLDEGLTELVRRGVSCNVASLVGAETLRVHELGHRRNLGQAGVALRCRHRQRSFVHRIIRLRQQDACVRHENRQADLGDGSSLPRHSQPRDVHG